MQIHLPSDPSHPTHLPHELIAKTITGCFQVFLALLMSGVD